MSKIKDVFFVLLQAVGIAGITIFAAAPVSCKITESGIQIVGGDYEAPVLQSVEVISDTQLVLSFSEEIKMESAVVSSVINGISNIDESSSDEQLSNSIAAAAGKYGSIDVAVTVSEDGSKVTVNLKEPTVIGKQYELYGVVEDSIGNTLNFAIPFIGFNSKIPNIIMTELHTGMASQLSSEKETNVRRLEYVEFLALTDGNLAGLEFVSGYCGENKKFVFPAVEVQKGELFVLHLRTWGSGCVSETGDDLTLAGSTYCGDWYRDLWTEQTTKCIGETTDIVVVRNSVSGKILDAVMYCAADVEEWSGKLKNDFSLSKDLALIYDSTEVENATLSTGLSGTKFLYRVNGAQIYDDVMDGIPVEYPVKVDCDSWAVCSTGTPGGF